MHELAKDTASSLTTTPTMVAEDSPSQPTPGGPAEKGFGGEFGNFDDLGVGFDEFAWDDLVSVKMTLIAT